MPQKKHYRPRPAAPVNRELTVKIERIVPNGVGIGFADGLTVFVALAAAGDLARVRINSQKNNIAFASLIEVVEPSPDRAAPSCPYFGRCGGCDFQQLNYAAQLTAKIEIIKDCLRRIGKIEWREEIKIAASPAEWNYRTRAQWKREAGKFGYFERNSHRVIDVAVCPILAPALQTELTRQRENLQNTDFAEIRAVSSGTDISISAGAEMIGFDENFYAANQLETEKNQSAPHPSNDAKPSVLGLRVGEFDYNFDAEVFFQVNHELLQEFVAAAIGDAGGDFALDLYCGVGLFALPLAKRFAQVTAVEGSSSSLNFARANAEKAGVRVEFINALVGEWLNSNQFGEKPPDFVLLDPPRTGAERGAIENLITIAPAKIVYVSCNPATLARDLQMLVASGKYEIKKITAFDFFPQTHHVETIVTLEKTV